FRELQVVPAVSVAISPELGVVPLGEAAREREIQATVSSNLKSAARGDLTLELAAGWSAEPRTQMFQLERRGDVATASFRVRIPAGVRPGTFAVEAVAHLDGTEHRRGYRVVSYPENWTRNLYRPARAELRVFDVRVAAGSTIGYVPGAGDEVPAALES